MRKPHIQGKLDQQKDAIRELPNREVAEYLGHILPELAAMARSAGMTDSAELIHMAARITVASKP